MNRKTISFRCPSDLLAELDAICEANYIERSLACTHALRLYLLALVAAGEIEAIEFESLDSKPPYSGKKRGRKPKVLFPLHFLEEDASEYEDDGHFEVAEEGEPYL